MTKPWRDGQPTTQFLSVPGGKIAYDDQGDGPLVILVPGMGELRSSFRHLVPLLVTGGYRVATVDLRGHGDSDTSFPSYGDVDTATDIALLLKDLGSPAVIVGNSMAAGSAVIVAAEHPELVTALVLIGPFVRNPASATSLRKLLMRLIMARPWVASAWNLLMPTLYSGRRPPDFTEYRKTVISSIRRPGYARAFSTTTRTDHDRAHESLSAVIAPTLVLMGDKDPDFKDPRAEADWVAEALGGTSLMIENSGHYPQSQQPDLTATAILRFLETVATNS